MKELRMRKSGLFYETFDEDAVIMHYLFNYKNIDERVAFPTNSLDKVTLDSVLTEFETKVASF